MTKTDVEERGAFPMMDKDGSLVRLRIQAAEAHAALRLQGSTRKESFYIRAGRSRQDTTRWILQLWMLFVLLCR